MWESILQKYKLNYLQSEPQTRDNIELRKTLFTQQDICPLVVTLSPNIFMHSVNKSLIQTVLCITYILNNNNTQICTYQCSINQLRNYELQSKVP